MVGIAADSMIPDSITRFGATRALRVASADANRLYLKNDAATAGHFSKSSPQTPTPRTTPQQPPLLYPHRQKTLDLNHHEVPLHNRKNGGRACPVKACQPKPRLHRATVQKEKHAFISYFISKEIAEPSIHQVLRKNSAMIDHWFKTAADRDAYKINGTLSGNGAILVENATRKNQFARRIEIIIIKQRHNGMAYYINTVKLY